MKYVLLIVLALIIAGCSDRSAQNDDSVTIELANSPNDNAVHSIAKRLSDTEEAVPDLPDADHDLIADTDKETEEAYHSGKCPDAESCVQLVISRH